MYRYVKNESESLDKSAGQHAMTHLRRIEQRAPLRWLEAGFSDLHACTYRSLVYGLFFVLMGQGIDQAHSGNPVIAVGLSAAFLFVGPFLSMGIYELSRQCQNAEPAELLLSLFSWCRNPVAVGRFAFFLSVVLLLWLWLSSILLATAGQGIGLPVLLAAVLWITLAFFVLLTSSLSIPMMLDRPVSAALAVRTSIRGFSRNPQVIAMWYLIVALAVIVSLVLNYWPLLILGPWLGHATWHAYQDCVAPEALVLEGTAGNL